MSLSFILGFVYCCIFKVEPTILSTRQFVVRAGEMWWWVAVVESGAYLMYVSISTTSPTPQIACYHNKLTICALPQPARIPR
jgi:hypothetical protein